MGGDLRLRVLDVIQSGFPISADPYGELAATLGTGADEVRTAVAQLRAEGVVRRIGASFDSRKLGYTSTLCALSVPACDIEAVAAQVNAHHQVTHNYERAGELNLWFTLITRVDAEKQEILGSLPGRVLDLPATHLFKIRVDFGAAREAVHAIDGPAAPFDSADPADVALVRWAQGDVADDLEHADPVRLGRLRELRANGTVRRFGAIVRHRKLGYVANAMTVWDVDDADVGRAGAALASNPAVSHCYARLRAPGWRYNLYAMVHAQDAPTLDSIVTDLHGSLETAGASVLGSAALATLREFKKTSMRYFE